MRVLVAVKATKASEAGEMPSGELIARMGKYNDELIAAGLMVDGAGLHPSSKGKRISFANGQGKVAEGPFAQTSELIAGYWIWNVKDIAEAEAWALRAPMRDGDTLELRPFFEPEDFAGVATPELIEQEKAWREAQLSKSPPR